MKRFLLPAIGCLCLVLRALADDAPLPKNLDFNRDVRPILSENCFACHGPDEGKRKGKLRLDLREVATQPAKSGAVAIIPGKLNESELVKRITLAEDDEEHMPPVKSNKHLTARQVAILKKWVDDGASYKVHWVGSPGTELEFAL